MLGFWCQVSIKIRILLSIISGQSKSHDLAPIRLPTPTLWRRKLSISIWISMASDDWLPLEIRNGFAFASNCDLPPTWQWCHHHINHTPQLPRIEFQINAAGTFRCTGYDRLQGYNDALGFSYGRKFEQALIFMTNTFSYIQCNI